MATKISVANVPANRTETEIKSVFGEAGKVVHVELLKNQKTGERLESCTVTFANEDEAVKAYLEIDGDFLGGSKPIKIRFYDSSLQEAAEKGLLGPFSGKKRKHFK